MLTIDVYKGSATNIGHTGTTKDTFHFADSLHRHIGVAINLTLVAATIYVTTNLDLPLHHNCGEESQNQYGDKSSHS